MENLFKKGKYSKSIRMWISEKESFIMRSIIDFDNSGIEQFRLALSEIPVGQETPEHVHNSDEIFYVLEGNGTFRIEGREYEVNEGDTFCVKANIVHGPNSNSGTKTLKFLYVIGQLKQPQSWHDSSLKSGDKPKIEYI